jgi:hypothetical protein
MTSLRNYYSYRKTKKPLSKYYNAKGHKTSVYKSNDTHLNEVFDIKGNSFNCEVSDFGIDKCEKNIEFLKHVTEEEVTSLNKYLLHFSVQETNKISQKLKIKKMCNGKIFARPYVAINNTYNNNTGACYQCFNGFVQV